MSTPQGTRLRLGDELMSRGLLDEQQLQVALGEQKRVHRPLGEILLSLGFVREDQIAAVVAESLGIEVARAKDLEPDELLVSAIDPAFVRSASAFPIELVEGTLRVAMVDPADPERVSEVRRRFPYPLEIVMITSSDLTLMVRKHLGAQQDRLSGLLAESAARGAGELPVEEIALAVIVDGVNRGATDVHVEPEENITRVRYRVDGVLHAGESLPREATDAVISRIKILAQLDIAERRRPQDGRLRLRVHGRDVDLRVSVMPCTHGENLVLRVLDRSGGNIPLAALGLPQGRIGQLQRIAERPHGLFLVTGPTGSGKTTTLYSLLGEVDAIHRNVATIEDPVEYDMPLIRQSQVEHAAGYGFHDGLRALLRQDPDVILVGEIRDKETADMAIKASMTGHLVFATLHTNSAVGAVPRLADLGIPPYLVEDALIGVLAQRLVRRVCEACAQPAELTPDELAWLQGDAGDPREGVGCEHCHESGYSGRTVISELFLPTDAIGDAMKDGADAADLKRLALESGFRTMTEDGMRKVRQGVTTAAEVRRVNRSHRLSEDERADV